MPNVISIIGKDKNGVRLSDREKVIAYTLTLSGNYVQHVRGTATGEVLDFTKAVGAFTEDQNWGQKGPSRVYILNPGGTGYALSIVPGADAFHWLLCIFSGVATELAGGAYPAPLTADIDIVVEATGRKFD